MATRKKILQFGEQSEKMTMMPKRMNANCIVPMPDEGQWLDSEQLGCLEQSFRTWVEATPRSDVRMSRKRMLVIFLLIRYTGAKLNEVLALNPFRDIDSDKQSLFFRNTDDTIEQNAREVQISEDLSGELQSMLNDPEFRESIKDNFAVDPAFVRRKFYERAQACGFSRRLVGPEMIRRSRAVELMQRNMPLQAVQKLLGHSTPNLTSTYVAFSEDEIRQVTKYFMEKEASRKTSARNLFFGKIRSLLRGDIQTRVELSTVEGHGIVTVITNDSLGRLGLKVGKLLTAEVKAPWVFLQKSDEEPKCTAENRFNGIVQRVNRGKVSTECVVRISDETELCAVVTTASSRRLKLKNGDAVWALFNCFSVVLHID